MIPGQLIAPGQLTDPEVKIASVHGLTPGATSRCGLHVVKHRVTRLAEVTFLHVNRTQKSPRGKNNFAHAHY